MTPRAGRYSSSATRRAKRSRSSSSCTRSLLHDTTAVRGRRRTALLPDNRIEADRVVALPRIEGLRLEGVPHDTNGFVPIDEHGASAAWTTSMPPATSRIPDQAGRARHPAGRRRSRVDRRSGRSGDRAPSPFTPVLRGLLLTGLSLAICAPSSGSRRIRASTRSRSGGRPRRSSVATCAVPGCPAERLAGASRLRRPRGRSRARPRSGGEWSSISARLRRKPSRKTASSPTDSGPAG